MTDPRRLARTTCSVGLLVPAGWAGRFAWRLAHGIWIVGRRPHRSPLPPVDPRSRTAPPTAPVPGRPTEKDTS